MDTATLAPNETVWSRYGSTAGTAWDLRQIVHLYRRAAFAATWKEIQQALADGPEETLDRVIAGKISPRSPESFEETAGSLGVSAVLSRRPDQLKAWWIYRMLFTADPLAEQLTLMWHDHFATSNLKVRDPSLMWQQNDTFRRLGRAPFGKLLHAMLHDPALLIFLDAPANRKGNPNENLARELIELFTLGVGNYTEADVKEAARALTGWTVDNGQCVHDSQWHDSGVKTILGQTGKWKADDLVNILLEHPATAARLAWRVCHHFLGEENVRQNDLDTLAQELRDRELDIGWAVETVLRSERFFEDAEVGSRIVPPVDHIIGAVRSLEQAETRLSTAVLSSWAAELGQDLFYPPNVGGWPGGRSWLSARTLVSRTRFAAQLAEGSLCHPPHPIDVEALVGRHGFEKTPEQLLDFLSSLMLGSSLEPAWREELLLDVANVVDGPGRILLTRLLASPPAQVG